MDVQMKTLAVPLALLFVALTVGEWSRQGIFLYRGSLHCHTGQRCLWSARVPGLNICDLPWILCDRCHNMAGTTVCKSNLRNLGTAIELYANDQGEYPPALAALTPQHLKTIPRCADVGLDTYSSSYMSSGREFTIVCSGWHHHDLDYPPNFPQYTSTQGLLER